MTTPNQGAAQAFGQAVGGQWGDLVNFVGQGAYQVGNAAQNWGQNITESFARAAVYGPATLLVDGWASLEHFLSALGSYLSTLPLEALQIFRAFIPDALESAFDTVAGAVEAIVNALGLDNMRMTLQAFQKWLADTFNSFIASVQGALDIPGALQSVSGQASQALSGVRMIQTSLSSLGAAVGQVVDTVANAFGTAGSGLLIGDLTGPIQIVVTTINQIVEILAGNTVTAVNSGVQAVKDWYSGLGGWQTTIGDALTQIGQILNGVNVTAPVNQAVTDVQTWFADVGSILPNTITNAGDAVNQLTDAANNALQGAGGAATGFGAALSNWLGGFASAWTGGAPATSDPVSAAAVSNNSTVTTTSQAIIDIQSLLPSLYGGGGGAAANNSVVFDGSGTLPAGFTMVAPNLARYDTPAETDTQTVSCVFSSPDNLPKYLFLRANSSGTSFVYVKLQSTTVELSEIGCFVAGVQTVFTTFVLPGTYLASAAAYSLSAVGDVFTVKGPGGLNVVFTDSSHVSQQGASYRYGGFGLDGWLRETSRVFTADYTVPSWADELDIVLYGGGGGGHSGFSYGLGGSIGAGGRNGASNTYSVAVADLVAGQPVQVTAGRGGWPQGDPNSPGDPGDPTTVTIPLTAGAVAVTAAGGDGGPSFDTASGGLGWSAHNVTLRNTTYQGGSGGGVTCGGNPFGGGGGGGTWGSLGYSPGAAGGSGGAWISAIDKSLPGNFGFWSFYDAAGAGPASAFVATEESTSSTTYTQLTTATDQVTVNVGSSGTVMVFLRAKANYVSGTYPYFYVGVKLSGANTVAASDGNAVQGGFNLINTWTLGVPLLLTGLTPGATTFQMMYRVSTGSASFANRSISVIPL